MGRLKQLLPLGKKTVIDHCIDSLVRAGIREIITVIAQDTAALREALEKRPVVIVVNRTPGSDMAESVKSGLSMVSPDASGILVCLADHPLVTAATIKRLAGIHKEYPERIIIPAYQKKRGHPTLFPKNILQEIFRGGTLRDIIGKSKERLISMDVVDEGVVLDMDTEEDYQQLRELAEERDNDSA